MATYQPVGMKTLNQTNEVPETKRKLVEAGVNLMRKQGFNATTVDDICSAAGVTKGSFFHYFKTKQEVAEAAVTAFREGKVRDFANAPFRKLADPLDRIFGRLDFAIEAAGGASNQTKGCLIGVFAQELAFTNPELRDLCQAAFLRTAADIEKDLAEAKALHAPKADFDPKKAATTVHSRPPARCTSSGAHANKALYEQATWVFVAVSPLEVCQPVRASRPPRQPKQLRTRELGLRVTEAMSTPAAGTFYRALKTLPPNPCRITSSGTP